MEAACKLLNTLVQKGPHKFLPPSSADLAFLRSLSFHLDSARYGLSTSGLGWKDKFIAVSLKLKTLTE